MVDDRLEVARGSADRPDATIATDPDTSGAMLWGGRPLTDAHRWGNPTVEDDKAAAERFVRLFPIPEPTTLEPTTAEADGRLREELAREPRVSRGHLGSGVVTPSASQRLGAARAAALLDHCRLFGLQ